MAPEDRLAGVTARRPAQRRCLPGLLHERPGPRRRHKLSEEVLAFLRTALAENPKASNRQLASLLKERFNLEVHPRSIERALQGGKGEALSLSDSSTAAAVLPQRHEELRSLALAHRPAGHGMVLLQHRGMPAWLGAWNQFRPVSAPAPATTAVAGPATTGTHAEIAVVLTAIALSAARR